MTWSYDPQLLKPKDLVRFKIGDTNESMPLISDEEIEATLRMSGNQVISAALDCVKNLLAQASYQVTYQIGPEKVMLSDRVSRLRALYSALRSEESSANFNPGNVFEESPPTFEVGMHDA